MLSKATQKAVVCRHQQCTSWPQVGRSSSHVLKPVGVWTRPTPDKDDDFIKPSYVPTRPQEPFIQPYRREDQPLYSPSGPEFSPSELPEKQKEMPAGPKMPERGPDPIPAGNPKEKPPGEQEQQEKREAPPPKK